MQKTDKNKLTIRILTITIIALLLFITFFFVIKPQIGKYADERRIEGIQYYVYEVILPQLQNYGYVQIPVGNETLILVPYIPEQSTA